MTLDDIILMLKDNPQYVFMIREYIDDDTNWYCEAIVRASLISDTIGVIIEKNPFNPSTKYLRHEVIDTFNRLQEKSLRIIEIIHKANLDFYHTYVKREAKKSESNKP